MLRPNLPEAVRRVVIVEHTYDHQEQGWTARDSVIPTDCRPVYRATGGGTVSAHLMPLVSAIDKSISNVESCIATAQRHLEKLKAARAAMGEPDVRG